MTLQEALANYQQYADEANAFQAQRGAAGGGRLSEWSTNPNIIADFEGNQRYSAPSTPGLIQIPDGLTDARNSSWAPLINSGRETIKSAAQKMLGYAPDVGQIVNLPGGGQALWVGDAQPTLPRVTMPNPVGGNDSSMMGSVGPYLALAGLLAGGVGLAGGAGSLFGEAAGGGLGALTGTGAEMGALGTEVGAGMGAPFLGGEIGTAGGAAWGVNPQLANPFTAPEIPEIYSTAPNLSGGTSALTGTGPLLNSLPNLPPTPPLSSGGSAPPPYDPTQPTTEGNAPPGLGSTTQTIPPTAPDTSAATSALAKLLGITDAQAQLLGAGGTTLAGLWSGNTIKDIFDKQAAARAPALAEFNNTLSPNWYTSPEMMGALDARNRALSVKFGNVAGQPAGMNESLAGALGIKNARLSALSGPAFGGEQTQALLGTSAANTQANALAGGLGNLTTPNASLDELLRQLRAYGMNTGMGLT